MKRLMLLVAMMAVVLLLPMNVVAAEGDVVNEDSYYNLTEDVVIQGDLYVVRDLDMGGYKLTVEGNVYMEEDILLDDGEGYISYTGNQFVNVKEKQNCNLCIKAFTNDR